MPPKTTKIKPPIGRSARPRSSKAEDHLGATEDKVGDRTGSGAGYDLRDRSKKIRRSGVKSS